MRIIGGEFRSRQILAPKSDATRPITDRVKQSLFDVLSGNVELLFAIQRIFPGPPRKRQQQGEEMASR